MATVNVRYMVHDVEAALTFYTSHLGFQVLTKTLPAFADVARGDLRLLLSGPASSAGRPMPDGRRPEPGGWNRIHLIVDDLAKVIWGAEFIKMPMPAEFRVPPIRMGGGIVPVYYVVLTGLTVAIALGMGWLMSGTRFGKTVHAAAQNKNMVAALGINTTALYIAVFGLGSLLAGALCSAIASVVQRATAPMAAMSERLTASALCPSRSGSASAKKCVPETSMSTVTTSSMPFRGRMTAASSPTPSRVCGAGWVK